MEKRPGASALVLVMALALAACGAKDETAPASDTAEHKAAASEAAPGPASGVATGYGSEEGEDALVPGTDYNATAQIMCGFKSHQPEANCPAGVKRRWGEDGTTLVEVTRPDGTKRALFFRGTMPYGADSAQADGSAGWDFRVNRQDDNSVIVFGPETYIVPDALIEGG